MFANAVTLVAEFTRPVLVSTRQLSGKIETGCGTYVLLNADGWILTAGHILRALLKSRDDNPKHDAYRAARQAIEIDTSLSKGARKQRLNALKCDRSWLTNTSYWWGDDNVSAASWHFAGLPDLAAVKLANYKFSANQKFAKFGDPFVKLPQGKSLCKLGYPFHKFETDFDDTTGKFVIRELPPLVRYPLDGIVTRYNLIKSPDGKRVAKFVEMSTPGLRGQSGGPWFDVNGTVWGIQSRTHHLPLGFSPEVDVKSKKITEHQFLNAGAAAYVTEIVQFLDHHKIAFDRM